MQAQISSVELTRRKLSLCVEGGALNFDLIETHPVFQEPNISFLS